MEAKHIADGATGSRAGISIFVYAAAYSAFIVSIATFINYGGHVASGIGGLAATVAFCVAFACALILAPIFALARKIKSEAAYFVLHLVVGVVIGAGFASRNQFASEWHQFVFVPSALMIVSASMAAWLVVFLVVSPGTPRNFKSARWIQFSGFVLLLACFILPMPVLLAQAPVDPSCHNVFRGGRSSAKPGLNVDLRLTTSEGRMIGSLYDEFAGRHRLDSKGHPLLPDAQQRSLCNQDVILSAGGVFEGGRHGLSAYPHDGERNWRPLTAELVCFLEKELTNELVFTGRGGEPIDRPAFLHPSCAE